MQSANQNNNNNNKMKLSDTHEQVSDIEYIIPRVNIRNFTIDFLSLLIFFTLIAGKIFKI